MDNSTISLSSSTWVDRFQCRTTSSWVTSSTEATTRWRPSCCSLHSRSATPKGSPSSVETMRAARSRRFTASMTSASKSTATPPCGRRASTSSTASASRPSSITLCCAFMEASRHRLTPSTRSRTSTAFRSHRTRVPCATSCGATPMTTSRGGASRREAPDTSSAPTSPISSCTPTTWSSSPVRTSSPWKGISTSSASCL
mmetsp:Transcript_5823/g.17932  ORF Transcript_5823/g.17932 Transcript_5823/m.17932 type:complete len:200 (-) Transcript_5823:773-1372(-)